MSIHPLAPDSSSAALSPPATTSTSEARHAGPAHSAPQAGAWAGLGALAGLAQANAARPLDLARSVFIRRGLLPPRSPAPAAGTPSSVAASAALEPLALAPDLSVAQLNSIRHKLRAAIEIVAPHAPAMAEAVAATFAIGVGVMEQESVTVAQLLLGANVASDSAWALGAIISEANNHFDDAPHSYRVSIANALGALAGITGIVGSVLSANESAGFNFTSASAWIGNAVATAAGAARLHDMRAKLLQLGSASASGAAGVAATLAAKAAKKCDSKDEAIYTLLFGALWLCAAVAAESAVLRDRHVTAQASRTDPLADPSPV